MEYPAFTRAEQRRLSEWIVSGFERYIEVWSKTPPLGGDAAHDWAPIRRYAEEFSGILRGNMVDADDLDLPQLRADLQILVNHQCPAVDVVQFLLVCTSGFHQTFSDGLRRVGLSERHLSVLRDRCMWAADIIRILRRP